MVAVSENVRKTATQDFATLSWSAKVDVAIFSPVDVNIYIFIHVIVYFIFIY